MDKIGNDSIQGNARATPAPRKKLRRDLAFVFFISPILRK
jgi:hypothetical protein